MRPAIFASEAKRKAGETLETWFKSSADFVRLVAVERQGLPALAANGVSLGRARFSTRLTSAFILPLTPLQR